MLRGRAAMCREAARESVPRRSTGSGRAGMGPGSPWASSSPGAICSATAVSDSRRLRQRERAGGMLARWRPLCHVPAPAPAPGEWATVTPLAQTWWPGTANPLSACGHSPGHRCHHVPTVTMPRLCHPGAWPKRAVGWYPLPLPLPTPFEPGRSWHPRGLWGQTGSRTWGTSHGSALMAAAGSRAQGDGSQLLGTQRPVPGSPAAGEQDKANGGSAVGPHVHSGGDMFGGCGVMGHCRARAQGRGW